MFLSEKMEKKNIEEEIKEENPIEELEQKEKTEKAEELQEGEKEEVLKPEEFIEEKTDETIIEEPAKEKKEVKKPFPWVIPILAIILLIAAGFVIDKFFLEDEVKKGSFDDFDNPVKSVVEIKSFYSSECSFCEENSVIANFNARDINITVESIDLAEEENKHFIQEFGLKSIPTALVNAKDLEEYPSEENLINDIFEKIGDYYVIPETYLDNKPHNIMWLEKQECGFETGEGKIFVEEFSDFHCEGCARILETTKNARETFAGEMIYRHKNYFVNEEAENAVIAAECAREQRRFFEFKRYLMEKSFPEVFDLNKMPLDNSSPEVIGRGLLLLNIPDSNKFNQCRQEKEPLDRIMEETELAESYGVNYAPSLVIDCQYIIQGHDAINQIEEIVCEIHPGLEGCQAD